MYRIMAFMIACVLGNLRDMYYVSPDVKVTKDDGRHTSMSEIYAELYFVFVHFSMILRISHIDYRTAFPSLLYLVILIAAVFSFSSDF